MFKLFKDAFKITNEGIILTIPLALFWLLITFYIDFSKAVVDSYPEMILSIITMIFMSSAFCAGWFYMVKKCVKYSKKHFIFDKDKENEALKLLKAVPTGIGRFFLHYIVVSLLFVAITMLMVFIIKFLSYSPLNQIYKILQDNNLSVSNPQEMKLLINQMASDSILNLFNALLKPAAKLFLIVLTIPTVFSFLMLLWMPEIIYLFKNPFTALFTSVVKIFKRFWKSLGLFIYIAFIQMIMSSIGTFSLINPILYMLVMIIYFYFIVYVVVLIFSYYDKEFIENRKKIKK